MARRFEALHTDAVGLRLHRLVGDRLTSCEDVIFKGGREAVDTVLRRAKLAGRVEIDGEVQDHFTDVLIDENGTWDQTIALDKGSYNSLKNHWMRCKLVRDGSVQS